MPEMSADTAIRLLHISMELWGAVFSLIMLFCMWLSRSFLEKRRSILIKLYLSVVLLLAADTVAWLYRGGSGSVSYWMVRISNFAEFFLSDLLVAVYHGLLCSYLPDREKNRIRYRIRLVYAIMGVAMLFVCISQFTGLYYHFDTANIYHRSQYHWLSVVLPVTGLLLDFSILIQCRKVLKKVVFCSMLSYIILPILGGVMLLFFYGVSLTNISICISSVFMFIVAVMEQNHLMEQKEREAYDLKTTIMLSQIRPHFIYNTLTSIKYLCRKDPDQAADTIDEFAAYLRGNLESLMAQKPISFHKELEHTRNYLAIEQRRFGDRIRVRYEIQEEYFLIPSLILQPIVENAVKHGIIRKENGGTILIRTERIGSDYYITVEDDGVGYTKEQKQDGRSHIGVENTRNRLKSMCGGDLEITGVPGRGTRVVIRVPAAETEEG